MYVCMSRHVQVSLIHPCVNVQLDIVRYTVRHEYSTSLPECPSPTDSDVNRKVFPLRVPLPWFIFCSSTVAAEKLNSAGQNEAKGNRTDVGLLYKVKAACDVRRRRLYKAMINSEG